MCGVLESSNKYILVTEERGTRKDCSPPQKNDP